MSLDSSPAGGGGGGSQRPGQLRPQSKARQDTLHDDIKTIREYIADKEVPANVEIALIRVLGAAKSAGKGIEAGEGQGAIKKLQEDVTQMMAILQKQGNKPSYAKAAAAHSVQETMPIPSRSYREIVIAPKGETEEQKRRNGRELVEEFQRNGAKEIVAARRLRSGDILVTTKDKTSKEKLQKETPWLIGAGTEAAIRRKRFTAIAHGIRTAQIDTRQQAEAIAEIYKQNPSWKNSVEILSVAWAKKAREGQTTAPLLISVAEPGQGDILVDNGILWNYQLHDCEPFYGECKVTQCFKCYQYKHVARMCHSHPMCGFCGSKDHITDQCCIKADPKKHRCGICPGGQNHTAWSRDCPTRKPHMEAARHAHENRPRRFLQQVNPGNIPSITFASSRSNDAIEVESTQRSRKRVPGPGEWQTPRARGRPTFISQEENNGRIDIMMREMSQTVIPETQPFIPTNEDF